MKAILFSCILFLTFNREVKSQNLFNGKDLSGWHADVPDADDNPNIQPSFIVRDGKLVSKGVPLGHLITDEVYKNYELVVKYRFVKNGGNCGVLVHCSTPRMLYKMFPKSIEVQMQHESAGDFWVIGEDIVVKDMEKYREGPKEKWGGTEDKERHIVAFSHNENPLGKWNTMKIICKGDEIKVWVNGKLVNYGFDATIDSGQIAIQAEGTEVEFKKIKIKKLN